MKKIMFNDRFGLTQAVLDGRKTQTRRITCDDLVTLNTGYKVMPEEIFCEEGIWYYKFKNGHIAQMIKSHLPKYKIGEVVAVAQSYRECDGFRKPGIPRWNEIAIAVGAVGIGWDNKMFVRANLMPHQIRITNVRIERLQDISDEDCLKEGIYPYYYGDEKEKRFYEIPPNGYSFDGTDFHYPTPREAFAHLIAKVSGKGTWERNPYVFVYDFELVKP